MDPSKRFVTIVLAFGVIVLVAAIAVGQRMGDRVLGQAAESGPAAMPIVTPAPTATSAPYGPDWKRSQTLAAAGDPGFPDPRIPPKPVPTLEPTPKATPPHRISTPTPNPNVPIWDRSPFRRISPSASPSDGPPTAEPSTSPEPTRNSAATPLP
ncbi:MAG: hypothetical protein M3R51_06745 [Candidatus Eremiobacteraeota bacterium]|nr:hypothetical protein [Candidatus Eremiobacteraeota bacterium]